MCVGVRLLESRQTLANRVFQDLKTRECWICENRCGFPGLSGAYAPQISLARFKSLGCPPIRLFNRRTRLHKIEVGVVNSHAGGVSTGNGGPSKYRFIAKPG